MTNSIDLSPQSAVDSQDSTGTVPSPRTRRRGRRDATATAERTITSPLSLSRRAVRIRYWIAFGVLTAALAVVALGPLYWLVTGSLKSTPELVRTPPTLFPGHAEWSNLSYAWSRLQVGKFMYNTILLAGGTLLAQLVIAVTGAYTLSIIRPAGHRIWLGLILATLFVPATIIFIPTYVTIVHIPIVHLNLINSRFAVWLPEAANAFNLYLLKRFFDQIPAELIDAARMDGANSAQVLRHVVLPLSRSIIAVICIFSIIASWKDFLWPKITLPDPMKQPISVALANLQSSIQVKYTLAALLIASIPPVVAFLLLQKRIIGGLADTGLTK
ncbi:MAG TPA: carbohydrate ABC transporter permease [Mycobacteriales bacterium]|jgi:multiple sugar transport system permease protein|nr:carbohydrate ABC transporter permease [Mycobacteriales bacterium]